MTDARIDPKLRMIPVRPTDAAVPATIVPAGGAAPFVPSAEELAAFLRDVEFAWLIPRMERAAADRAADEATLFGRPLALPHLPLPFLGQVAPPGWTLVQEYLVDATGLGDADDPAMTVRDFVREMARHPGAGWGLRAVAPLAVLVARFAPSRVDLPDPPREALGPAFGPVGLA